MRGTPEERTILAIAARMRVLLDSQGGNQARLCREAGLHPPTFNNWLRAKGRPDLDQAIKLCDAFDLTLDWIYFGDTRRLPNEIADAAFRARDQAVRR